MQASAGSSSDESHGGSASTAPQASTRQQPSSDRMVALTMQKGLEQVLLQTGAGLVLGGLVGIVLARGGSSGARKAFAGFGAGVGLGSGWTRTSMDLEELLQQQPSSSKK